MLLDELFVLRDPSHPGVSAGRGILVNETDVHIRVVLYFVKLVTVIIIERRQEQRHTRSWSHRSRMQLAVSSPGGEQRRVLIVLGGGGIRIKLRSGVHGGWWKGVFRVVESLYAPG
ncbi:hypothetical protein LshimejAT787_0407310 [Lyophyllum shimeji]|uniref:Uncharacterized protein n=1 Tax=Lyophyllum shimeji TaxID=47721 RepID=A0A9P3PK27_LYOSH|nr:hypothetical protein LshimejAT787_0407310 [Lyophyllum shimeji]